MTRANSHTVCNPPLMVAGGGWATHALIRAFSTRPLKWAGRQWICALVAANTALAVGPVKIQSTATPGRILLGWDAVPGRSYVVEASDDLADWDEVTRVSAIAGRLNSVEIALPGPKTFWRVRELGGAPAVSPVRATYTLTGDQSAALLSLTTGDEPPLAKVEFFADGVLLGEAEPGQGNTWSFSVLTGVHPEIRDIHAEVTAEDGGAHLVPAARFLLADPTRFVPAGPAGERRFGGLVEVDGAGKLGAFYFYPEGVSDGRRESGAFFAFPAGAATLTGADENAALGFTAAKFHRGPQDGEPITAGANPSPLRLASITPQEVNQSFGRDPDAPIDLQFGGVSVKWEQGALGPAGWSGLKVRIPIGDFLLPGDQLDTEVVIGPGNSLDSLVVTYAGDWRPLAEGPDFEVPPTDPLRLYLNGRGEIRARGSVIARLANGGSLRGSVSWSPPFFEINLEGRKIIVPSLGALRGVLPTGSEAVVTSALVDGSAEALAAAEATLSGFQQTLAQTARAATEQSPETAPLGALAPASEASASAAALAAWAARLSTWAVDRSGQTLDAEETANLTGIITNATNAAKGAADISLVAAIWSGLVTIDKHQTVAGTGEAATALAAVISSSLSELLAVRERLASGALPQDLELLANHTLPDYVNPTAAPTQQPTGNPPEEPVVTGAPPAARERDLATREADRKAQALFGTLRVPAAGPADPAAVAALNLPARLSALATLADVFERQGRISPGRTIDSPELVQYRITFDVLVDGIEPALAANRAAAIAHGDFAAIQLALKQQLEFANSHRTLTGAPPPFDPEIIDLMDASVAALEAAILRTAPRKRQALATEHMQLLGGIVAISRSPEVGVFLGTLLDRLSASGDQFRALVSGSPDCDELLQALKAGTGIPFKPLRPNNHPLADGAAAQLAISGTYESTGSHGGKSYTLQLNRAGQYLLGRLQEHEPRRQTKSWELEGLMLGDETAAGIRFSCLRFRGSGGLQQVLLDAAPAADGVNLSITTSPEGQVVEFRRTSTRPFYSSQFSGRMTGEVKSVFDASIRAPLHQDQQALMASHINALHEALLDWQNATGFTTQPGVKRVIADAIDSACTRLLNNVSQDQIPLLRQFTRSRLSGVSERPIPGTTAAHPLAQRLQKVETGQKTQWTLLLEVFRDRNTMVDQSNTGDTVLSSCALLLTGESLPNAGATLYTYRCQINKSTLPSPIPVTGGGITFEIKRELNGQVEETMFLAGGFTQAGAGVPLGKISDFLGRFSGGTGGDEVIVTSPVRYTEAELSGTIIFGSAGGMATTFGFGTTPGSGDIAISRGVGGFTLAGPLSLNKPALVLPLPFKSGSQEIGLGLEAAVGIGGVASFSAFNGEVDIFAARLQPLKGPARRGFELGQQTVFNTGSSDLTDCGWTQLRQFVAEYRSILDDPAAKVTLIGLTDTVGSDAANLTLSENRNLSVLAAITRILGHAPGSAESPLRILSLGEQPARSDLPLPTGLNATETALLQQMRAELGTTPAGSPQSVPGWRVVRVLLNNTIYFDLNSL